MKDSDAKHGMGACSGALVFMVLAKLAGVNRSLTAMFQHKEQTL